MGRPRPSPSSKGGSGSFDLIIVAILVFMLTKFFPFILAAVLPAAASLPAAAQAVEAIPSRLIKVVEFEDRGKIYRVNLETGEVTSPLSPEPSPIPPKPVPPTPALTGLALRVNEWFTSKITAPDRADTAQQLANCIEVTLAKAGGLGLKGQDILDDLADGIDQVPGLRSRLSGFPLGDALKVAIGDEPSKIVQALKDAKTGLEAVR